MSKGFVELYPRLPLYKEAAVKKISTNPQAVRVLMNAGAALHRIHSGNWGLLRAKAELGLPIERANVAIRLRISKRATPYLFDLLSNKQDRGLAIILFHLGVMNHIHGEDWFDKSLLGEQPIKSQPILIDNKNETTTASSSNKEPDEQVDNKSNSKLVAVESGDLITQLGVEGLYQ
ncbi:hypothetical protein J4N45_10315 [Vibrio sp. SCSIO 43140]|uniref:hypothetical protein n=1 Tax=Vibrio sp. SCSIO 43140 TaxID=2819100 RepID=UPI00207593FC|nr:hypothetical protein [Vibrio sp. SCSIO 43140]USD58923.1 hypothetical protein J4N45_10315 [Vibrio sp. SCSIO 43140]